MTELPPDVKALLSLRADESDGHLGNQLTFSPPDCRDLERVRVRARARPTLTDPEPARPRRPGKSTSPKSQPTCARICFTGPRQNQMGKN